jgi:hypothetical protein
LQQIPTPATPKLDFVDFVASITAVSLTVVEELAKIPEFCAAVSAYRSRLTLGYCGFSCWPAVHKLFEPMAEEPLLDYLRVAAYCSDLPAYDRRHVKLDRWHAKPRFPALVRDADVPVAPERSSDAASLLAEMGSFAPRHEFRTAAFPSVKKYDEDEYLAYLDQPD